MAINGITILPGERKSIMIPMPKLYDCTPMNMPVEVIKGKENGPVLCVTASIHGDELNGVEIIRRLKKKRFLKKLKGTLILVPVVNTYGFLYQSRYLLDRRDLNRSFPGSEKGSLAGRLANLFVTEILAKITHLIDLHAGSNHRTNLPQIRANTQDKETKRLSNSFGAPVVLYSKEPPGSLREAAVANGVKALLYESGEALRLSELCIKLGVEGVLNVMRSLNMIEKKSNIQHRAKVSFSPSSYWVRSAYSGIMCPLKSLGAKVSSGDAIAIVSNPLGNEEHKVIAKEPGIIIGQNCLPLVYEGAALFNIACLKQTKKVASNIQDLKESFGDDSLESNGELDIN